MQIQTQSKTNPDGSLDLHLSTNFPDANVKVMIWVEPEQTPEQLGWPLGYFEELYGCMANDPLVEPDDLPLKPVEGID